MIFFCLNLDDPLPNTNFLFLVFFHCYLLLWLRSPPSSHLSPYGIRFAQIPRFSVTSMLRGIQYFGAWTPCCPEEASLGSLNFFLAFFISSFALWRTLSPSVSPFTVFTSHVVFPHQAFGGADRFGPVPGLQGQKAAHRGRPGCTGGPARYAAPRLREDAGPRATGPREERVQLA